MGTQCDFLIVRKCGWIFRKWPANGNVREILLKLLTMEIIKELITVDGDEENSENIIWE